MEKKQSNQFVNNLSIIYGSLLITWAILVSFLASSQSITSFIPGFIGLPILFCGILSKRFISKKKLFIHIAVFFGFIAFIGGIDFFRGLSSSDGPFANLAAGSSKLFLFLTGALYMFFCIKSFVEERKNS